MLNILDLSVPKHSMHGLLEVNVKVAWQFVAVHKGCTGETLSFTGFHTLSLARAMDEDKAVQAYLKGRKHLALFDDVNIGVMIEHKVGRKRALMGYIFGGANRKTYREICDEIRSGESAPVLSDRGMPSWFRAAQLETVMLEKMK